MGNPYKGYFPILIYISKTGRKYIQLRLGNKRKELAFARYKIEVHIGRFLDTNEVVHHIDKDHTNDDISNLKIVSRSEHQSFHKEEAKHPVKLSSNFVCPSCKKNFILEGHKLAVVKYESLRNYKNRGPYCSRKCQHSGMKKHVSIL